MRCFKIFTVSFCLVFGESAEQEKNDVGKLCHCLPYIDEMLSMVGEKKGETKQGKIKLRHRDLCTHTQKNKHIS